MNAEGRNSMLGLWVSQSDVEACNHEKVGRNIALATMAPTMKMFVLSLIFLSLAKGAGSWQVLSAEMRQDWAH